MGCKIVFGTIIFWFAIQVLLLTSRHARERIRPDLLAAQVLVLVLPVRSVRPDGTRLYSAMLYRVAFIPTETGKRVRKVQFYPKNFEPWGE